MAVAAGLAALPLEPTLLPLEPAELPVDPAALCMRWARGLDCPKDCRRRHACLNAEEEAKAARARTQRQLAVEHEPESPHADVASHSKRSSVFVDFLLSTFGEEQLRATEVLDVAGGRGAVSFELHCRRGIPCTLLEPREIILKSHQRRFLRKHDVRAFPHLRLHLDPSFPSTPEGARLLEGRCTLLGLHPDQATEQIVDLALAHGCPFAIVPCCVYPDAFSPRKLADGTIVRSYEAFCEFLLEKAPPGVICATDLPLHGKSKVLYRVSDASRRSAVAGISHTTQPALAQADGEASISRRSICEPCTVSDECVS